MEIQNINWYKLLVSECKNIIKQAVITSSWALVNGYWKLGKRMREDKNFTTKLLQDLAVEIGMSERTLWYALQVHDKYPEINQVPKVTWNQLITDYLPESKKSELIEIPPIENNLLNDYFLLNNFYDLKSEHWEIVDGFEKVTTIKEYKVQCLKSDMVLKKISSIPTRFCDLEILVKLLNFSKKNLLNAINVEIQLGSILAIHSVY